MKHGDFSVGLDLGQVQDYTAAAVVQVQDRPTGHLIRMPDGAVVEDTRRYCLVRDLWRADIGTPYATVAKAVAGKLGEDRWTKAKLIVDATGVGLPVVEMLLGSGVQRHQMEPVLITGGATAQPKIDERGIWHVAKRELASVLHCLLQERRLVVAKGLKEAKTLERELSAFSVKISQKGNDTYEAAKESDHDDLVMALALACWWAVWTEVRPNEPLRLPSTHKGYAKLIEETARAKARKKAIDRMDPWS
jgi:hypothetical protein